MPMPMPVIQLLLVLMPLTAGVVPTVGAEPAQDLIGAQPRGVWPLQPPPTVVQGFDPPDSPYGAGHRGVDLAGTVGEPVHAALAGTVTYAGLLAGTRVVVVDHGTTRTTYEPVTATAPVGTVVAPGAIVGTLALPGSHCLPAACLHWGWIRNADDVYLDPLLLVGAGPMRLLPVD